MRALLVSNPRAGRMGGRRGAARTAAELARTGMEVKTLRAPSPSAACGELRSALRDADPRETRVVVDGGDGTLNALLPALLDTDVPVALVPTGTLNVLARDLGVPLRWQDAVALAAAGRPRRVDVGVVNGRPFLDMVGIGYDAAIVHDIVPAGGKTQLSYPGYVTRAAGMLARYRPRRVRITVDERTFEAEAWMAVIANTTHYAYHWRVAPYAEADDGLLDLCLFRSRAPGQMVGQALALLAGRHASFPGVEHLRARHLRIACDAPLPVQADGDAAGWTPVEVGLRPAALQVIAPEPVALALPRRAPLPVRR